MTIYEVPECSDSLLQPILTIWETFVRATHHFLSNAEIARIRDYVPQAVRAVEHLVLAEDAFGTPVAFLGAEGHRLEMLFLAPPERGKGIGRQLLQYGVRHYGIREVTVNEQNPQAVGFYEHLGFETYRRTDCDENGDPYPLLYMKLVR